MVVVLSTLAMYTGSITLSSVRALLDNCQVEVATKLSTYSCRTFVSLQHKLSCSTLQGSPLTLQQSACKMYLSRVSWKKEKKKENAILTEKRNALNWLITNTNRHRHFVPIKLTRDLSSAVVQKPYPQTSPVCTSPPAEPYFRCVFPSRSGKTVFKKQVYRHT